MASERTDLEVAIMEFEDEIRRLGIDRVLEIREFTDLKKQASRDSRALEAFRAGDWIE